MRVTLKAAQRLMESMPITEGDNYRTGEQTSYNLLGLKASRFKVININQSHKQVLLSYQEEYESSVGYMLLGVPDPKAFAARVTAERKERMRTLAEGAVAIGRISVEVDGVVLNVWVNKDYRRQGIGTALYRIAHHYCPHGLTSSDDLGSMSLGVWLSLLKKESKLYLEYRKSKYKYSDIKVDSDMSIFLTYKGNEIDITTLQAGHFQFVWPK